MTRVLSTIPAALSHAAKEFGDAEAVADPRYGVRLSYRQLLDRARRVANVLVEKGVRLGDRVAICSPNTYHWIEATLGVLHSGATVVPINTRFTGAEMLDIIQRSNARALFMAGPFLGVDRLVELHAAGFTGLPVI